MSTQARTPKPQATDKNPSDPLAGILRDFSDPKVVAQANRELEASLPGLMAQLEAIEKSKHVSRKLLDMEITI